MVKKQARLSELAEMVEGRMLGEDVLITGLAAIEQAGKGDITFMVKVKGSHLEQAGLASAVIVPDSVSSCSLPAICVKDPYLASAIIHGYFVQQPFEAKGIDQRAVVGENCRLAENITVMAGAVIGDGAAIGGGTLISPGVVIGEGAEIGEDCVIHANVTIEEGCRLGNRVIIHAGTVIGSDGFGYAADAKGRHIKRPQIGIVVIGDEVEIGANCCIDRAAFGITEIGAGSKFDNLVQIGHNVVMGENCIVVAQVGVAGSVNMGRNVVIGGQAGIGGHITLHDGAMVAARSGVHSSLDKGAVVGGYPAIPVGQWGRASAVYARLPELRKEVRALRKELEALKEKTCR
ncbi:MAG: UDP-3-O-(3-hydroxymyristoyl)glucosamine N-acyltransferase [Deltaproteobacteria bacterium]|nr:MAG: UDP-3-O-(3-hydroxymyristoyl)glucosamine N-acyltransferase [Deltaproteobacteria bacterium]